MALTLFTSLSFVSSLRGGDDAVCFDVDRCGDGGTCFPEESNLTVGERGGVEYASFIKPSHFDGLGNVVNRNVLTTLEFTTVGTVVVVMVAVVVAVVVDDIVLVFCFVNC